MVLREVGSMRVVRIRGIRESRASVHVGWRRARRLRVKPLYLDLVGTAPMVVRRGGIEWWKTVEGGEEDDEEEDGGEEGGGAGRK